MRIRVFQQTVYDYAPPAKSLVQTLRLTPRNHDGQFVVRWRIDLDVDGRLRPGEDAFANITHQFSAAGPLDRLVLTVEGEVETHDTAGVVRGTVERFPEQLYLRESPLAMASEPIRAFAEAAAAQAGDDTLARLHALMKGIHARVAAGPGRGTAAESFAAGAGDAQDAAQVFVASARHLGIPCRFVSGFVHREAGEAVESGHAWAEAFVPGLGWVGFDPVLDICPAGAHVRVAIGIDALGAASIRAASFGGAREHRTSRIEVQPREPGRPPGHGQSQAQSQS